MSEAILESYDHARNLYQEFTQKVSELLLDISRAHDIHLHSVTCRVKDRDSLAKKLAKPEANYSALADVTDLAGVRIITYFEDDVDKVARLIEQEFLVDPDNSVDKRALLDPDRFGYLSLHHVVSLSPDRSRLTEYQRFPTMKAEVQTRSILQHAWAEIEHDLGYKSKQEIPQTIRRRFSRLAGLLELADQEFLSIRNELSSYEQELPERIETSPQSVTLDKASLSAFVLASPLTQDLDRRIASFDGAPLTYEADHVSSYLKYLEFFGITTIGELEETLSRHSAHLLAFAESWLDGGDDEDGEGALYRGISLFYLGYVLSAETGNKKQIESYINTTNIRAEDRVGLADQISETYAKIRESNS